MSAGVEGSVDGDRLGGGDDVFAAERRVLPDHVDGDAVPGVPAQLARQTAGDPFDRRPAVRRIEHQRRHVPLDRHSAVDLGLDVVIEITEFAVREQREQRHPVGGADVGRFEHAVGKAERDPVEGVADRVGSSTTRTEASRRTGCGDRRASRTPGGPSRGASS